MVRLLIAVLLGLGAAAPSGAQRLPDTFVPRHYTLWFGPSLATETFRATATIEGRLTRAASAVTLHAAELTFSTVRVVAADRTDTARVTTDATAETITLTLDRPVPTGDVRIEFTYAGVLNDKLRGFYISRANGRRYAVTQMEATDARRAFPSVDEPAAKATFDISVTADAGDNVLSNERQVSDIPGPEPGTHTVTFARTQKMSTYLVAMLVGDFACRETRAGSTVVRACATPDKLSLTDYALETARRQLLFFNDYFGIPYPFGKLDVIAVPDFSAGAMENAGAITFRERLLLVDPDTSSLDVQKRVSSIIAHELAHQWFGNLVTMAWWDDIWLNEGFATWIASKPLAADHPDWRMPVADAEGTQGALGIDALSSTRPIRLRVNTPQEIGQVFDGIAYGKTAAVLRMIEAYVGAAPFREAIRAYLRRFAFGNATGEDFWTEVARVTGRPVDRILRSFVDQTGAPVVAARGACRTGGGSVTLAQSRFVATPGAPASDARWTLPVCVRSAGQAGARCELLDDRETTLQFPGCEPRFVNADGVGYYFTDYTPDTVRALAANVSSLSPAERLRLLGDEWWMVRAERHDIGVYLDVTDALADDATPEVLDAVASRLAFAGAYLVTPSQRLAFQAWVRGRFRPALDALGWPGTAVDAGERQSRRATLLELVGATGNDPEIQHRAQDLARRYLTDASALPPTLASTVLRIGAMSGDAVLYEGFLARAEALRARPEEYYRFLNALPSFRDPALAQRTLALALSPDIRSQDTAALVSGVLASGGGRDAAWAFVQARWPDFTTKLDVFQGLPALVSALGVFCSPAASREITTFFSGRDVSTVDRSLRQAIERIDTCAALAAAHGPSIDRWLATRRR